MAYRFKRRETIADAYRRVVDEQFAALSSDVLAGTSDGIHSARKRTKMLRALLQLVQRGCDVVALRRADDALEKIARALAPVRDAEVRLQTLEAVISHAGPRAAQRFADVRGLLSAQASTARQLSLTPSDLGDVAALATAARQQLAALPVAGKAWQPIGAGLERAYRRGRKGLERATEDPSAGNRHEWRQRVKTLWHHVQLLEGCQPRKLRRLAGKLERLGEQLGEEHDLALLHQHLERHGRRSRSPAAFAGVISLLDDQRARLRRAADALGRKLYREKPTEFVAELKHAWQQWRQ